MRAVSVPIRVKKRIHWGLAVVAVLFAGLLARLVWIQLINGQDLRNMAFSNRFQDIKTEARRGVIYDSHGKPLAISVSVDSFYAIPKQVNASGKAEAAAQAIAEILGKDPEQLLRQITKNQYFVWIQRKVSSEQAQAIHQVIEDLELSNKEDPGSRVNLGISSVEEPKRFYPKNELMANVIGFVGMDNQGLEGLETFFDKTLSGVPGTILVESDKRGQIIPDAVQKYIAPEDGNSIILCIDETIQYITERELDNVMRDHNPERAGIIVMEPKTGRILAMALRPTYNPNVYSESDSSQWRNFLISDSYEPGSTFKTVTMASALEEGTVGLNDHFYCGGSIKVGGHSIKCWSYYNPHGSQTFVKGVQNSCNPVFITVALEEGTELFYKYLNGFGFGQKTGIRLPGETTGILMDKDKVKDLDLGAMAIGQTNAVTPIQLITAFSAIANGGNLMKPQLIDRIVNHKGEIVEEVQPEMVRQVISRETAHSVMEILELVVSQGTGKSAYIEGFRVGGKTGTAQKPLSTGGYSKTDYISSFLGAAPVNDPQVTALVVIDSPKGAYYGGQTAAPAFERMMSDILKYLQVESQVESSKINASQLDQVTLPRVVGMAVEEARRVIEQNGLKVSVMGDGAVIRSQLPLENEQIARGGNVLLYTKEPSTSVEALQLEMPDFTGMTGVQAMDLAKQINVNVELSGKGLVVNQEPIPGAKILSGSRIHLVLEDFTEEAMELIGP
jgi:stage V sporulation protein D (sporulation-specific penicillin-binding protein)